MMSRNSSDLEEKSYYRPLTLQEVDGQLAVLKKLLKAW